MLPPAVHRKGNAEVSFTIPLAEFSDRDAFPARLSQHVERLGWRRRHWQFLNPTHALTFDWERSGGGVQIARNDPKRTVDFGKWRGEWDDAQGNVLEYHVWAFRVAKGPGHHLRVFAAYIPADLVKAGVNAELR